MLADRGPGPETDLDAQKVASVPDAAGAESRTLASDPPAISLPKGGGAISGIGEKFRVNAATGTSSFSVPLAISPGRAGFGPDLDLSYDSGAGNGPFGFGWTLSIPTITRKTDKGLPRYEDATESDVFVLSGAEDLVPVLTSDDSRHMDLTTAPDYVIQRYRPRVEGLFARIERWTRQATGEVHWRSISRDNVTTLYGETSESRISDGGRVFSWLITTSYDDKGNAAVYSYAAENDANVDKALPHERNRARGANRYLKRVRYGNTPSRFVQPDLTKANWMFEVVFDYDEGHYEELALDPDKAVDEQHRLVRASPAAGATWGSRPDPFSTYRSGFEVRTHRRCRRVLMFHRIPELGPEPCLVRATEFDYADLDYANPISVDSELAHKGSSRFASFVTAITQSGYVRDTAALPTIEDGAASDLYLRKSLPPLELEYSRSVIQDSVRDLDLGSSENLPAGLDGSLFQWADLDGEGVSGFLTEQAGALFYKPSLGGGRFGPLQTVARKPSLGGLASGGQQLLDLDGDGRLDLATFGGATPGFYERTDDDDWESFEAFHRLPNVPWDDPNLRFVDLDGDGHSDVLVTEDDVLTWYPSLGAEGFDAARHVHKPVDDDRGPRLVFADGTASIYLADMCGDGLTDLVRVRNGGVCYWPNLGHGRFGAKVTLDNAPWFDHPDEFDQRRVHLADLDGTGTTDIVYARSDGVRLYFNQSGNRFTEARTLPDLPHLDRSTSITTVDLLGNGTTCLVWSSPLPADGRRTVRYVDLMGRKPHLLVKIENNLGAETHIEYAPSTRFYLDDKAAGRPWITRLPFPVQVVERVTTYDRVSRNRFDARYAYHHGYFDGVEREFRGFAMVEQWDTEALSVLTATGKLPTGANVDAASHVPPVRTKTWFHTGVYLGRGHVSDFFAGLDDDGHSGEYYRDPGLTDGEARALLLDDTILPAGLTVEEEREACRALKGMLLREEVYAEDGTARVGEPYRVREHSFGLRLLQPRADNRHAVFYAHPLEALTYMYERNPADPRIEHSLILEVDDFGNVLEEASVAYGRRQPDLTLELDDQNEQARTLVTYTERSFTNAIGSADDYRVPLPSESATYEITGPTLASDCPRFSLTGLRATVGSTSLISYEESATPATWQRRRIEAARTLYRANLLTGPLPLGQIESRALPFETYKLALTPGLVANVFGSSVTDAMLTTEAGYVHSDDPSWWVPSGRTFFSPDPTHTPAQELANAAEHFYLPLRFRDPFHTSAVSTETFVAYDGYDLLPVETRDPLDNRVTAGERGTTGALVKGGNDYRVLQPTLVTDPNGNRSAVAFDALWRVAGTAVMGKPPPATTEGDSMAGFEADLTDAVLLDHLANPLGDPKALLEQATTRIVCDAYAYLRTKSQAEPQPAVVYTLARETHESDPVPAGGLKMRHAFSYSDGFGREIQKKIQAEPGPVPTRTTTGRIEVDADGYPLMTSTDHEPRWVGSGWTVFNNKGKPVRRYEPFFTDTHRFELDVRIGVSSVLFYDPLERVAATLHADHTWEKVVFDPWSQSTWDGSDTALVSDPRIDADVGAFFTRLPETEYLPTWQAQRSGGALGVEEQAAAVKAAVHANTPTVTHADPLGRAFVTIGHNKVKYSNASVDEQFHRTRVTYDVEGNQREVIDAKGRLVMRYDYDLLGTGIRQSSMEAGRRSTLHDVSSKPVYAWDSRDHRIRTAYDALRRPTDSFLSEASGAEAMIGRTVYGEGEANATANNLHSRVVRVFDQAGVVTTDHYDFKGNALVGRRQLAKEYKAIVDWSVALVPRETEIYESNTQYDAVNRPTEVTAPDESVTRFGYNDANLLERVDVNIQGNKLNGQPVWTPFVTNVNYDAKGQRTLIDYGNGVRTTYAYDQRTSRLVRLQTRRDATDFPGDCPTVPPTGWPGCHIQNLHYTYDAVGDITHIRDDAQQTIFFRNQRVEPTAEYTYDALHRLVEATGREHLGQIGGSPIPHSHDDGRRVRLLHPGDGRAMGRYLERYFYDSVGNFESMVHQGSDPAHPGWTRTYAYDETSLLEPPTGTGPGKKSNRVTSTTVGAATEVFSSAGDGYDAHGNMLHMPQLQIMQWDFSDQLQMTQRQAINGDDADGLQHQGERTWYVYDANGHRVRKVTNRQAMEDVAPTRRKERVYLGGFEVYREYSGDGATTQLIRTTLDVHADDQRIALIETRRDVADEAPLIRYQLGNHIGSTSLELDAEANVISFEEYSPYGSTTYQAVDREVGPKRYRFVGQERDEESGLVSCGVRYYAPWLARWTSCDPAGLVDGENLYGYARQNPVRWHDPSGHQAQGSGAGKYGPLTVAPPIHKTDALTVAPHFPDKRFVLAAAPSDTKAKVGPVTGMKELRGLSEQASESVRNTVADVEKTVEWASRKIEAQITAVSELTKFVTGTSSPETHFGPTSASTKELFTGARMATPYAAISDSIAKGQLKGGWSFSTSGSSEGMFKQMGKDFLNLVTAGVAFPSQNPTETYTGSWSGTWEVKGDSIQLTGINLTSASSGTRIPIEGWGYSKERLPSLQERIESGGLDAIFQNPLLIQINIEENGSELSISGDIDLRSPIVPSSSILKNDPYGPGGALNTVTQTYEFTVPKSYLKKRK